MDSTSVSPLLLRLLLSVCTVLAAVLVGVFVAYLKSQSELRQTRHAVRRARERCFSILNALPPAIVVLSEHGVIEDFNRAAEKMFGCAARDIVRREINSLRLLSLEDGAKPFNPEGPTLGGRPRVGVRAQARRLDGVTFPVELLVSEARMESGRRLVGVVQDIVEKRPAEEPAAKESASGWPILEATAALVVVVDQEGRIVRMNGACRQLIGYQETEVVGSFFWDVLLEPEAAAAAREDFERQRLPGMFGMEELEWRGKDGRRLRIAFRIKELPETPGQFVVTGFDITDRVQDLRQRVQETRMQALAHLAGEIGARFNNWLTLVAGYSDLVSAGLSDNDAARSDLEEMRTAAGQAVGLSRELEAFAGKQVLQPKLVDVNELVGALAAENPRWETNLTPALGLVKVDPEGLRQALVALADQARQWSPEEGAPTLISAEVSDHAGYSCVMLAVVAEQAEMPPDAAARLFEPFGPAQAGVPAAYGFLKQSGGDIQVRDRPGYGVRFEIYLPRVAADAASAHGGA